MNHAKCLLLISAPLLVLGCSHGPRYCPYCGADLETSPRGVEVPRQPATTAPAIKIYEVAPAKLFEIAQQALKEKGLAIASAQNGVIQTDWKACKGEFHIARRWQEQTRYRVSVIPDISDPANAARFEVTEETQRRSNDRASWQPAEPRPERIREITEAIGQKAS